MNNKKSSLADRRQWVKGIEIYPWGETAEADWEVKVAGKEQPKLSDASGDTSQCYSY